MQMIKNWFSLLCYCLFHHFMFVKIIVQFGLLAATPTYLTY
uniref:Uncharacterized protein n=1 Tax=Arundo donax TaxID=35708 RepID=A0A0A8ZNT5_ARUDO